MVSGTDWMGTMLTKMNHKLCRSIINLHPMIAHIGEIEGYNPFYNGEELMGAVETVVNQSGEPFVYNIVDTEEESLKAAMRNYVKKNGESL